MELSKVYNELNNNINLKASGSYRNLNISKRGWYRFAKYNSLSLTTAKGCYGNSTIFSIKQAYGYNTNISIIGNLNSVYEKSNINILGKCTSNETITKIRHTVDIINNLAYLEFYYNSDVSNNIGVELVCSRDTYSKWIVLNEFELTSENVDGVEVYSEANLNTNNRTVISNSDLENHKLPIYIINTNQDDLNNVIDTVTNRYQPYSYYKFFIHVGFLGGTLGGGMWFIDGYLDGGKKYGVQKAIRYSSGNVEYRIRSLYNSIWGQWISK